MPIDCLVLCCRRREMNWRQVKTVELFCSFVLRRLSFKFAHGTRQNCSVSNISKTRPTENCLDLSPTQFTPPTRTRQDSLVVSVSVSVVWTTETEYVTVPLRDIFASKFVRSFVHFSHSKRRWKCWTTQYLRTWRCHEIHLAMWQIPAAWATLNTPSVVEFIRELSWLSTGSFWERQMCVNMRVPFG